VTQHDGCEEAEMRIEDKTVRFATRFRQVVDRTNIAMNRFRKIIH
jgi:hypothetical protein